MEIGLTPYDPHKVLCWPHRINELIRGKIPNPVTLMIDPTNKCRYRCIFCSSTGIPRNMSLSGEEMKDLIHQGYDLDVQGTTFAGGGEPLDNPDTPSAIQEAYDTYLQVGMITNGYGLKKPAAMRAAETCRWVRVSISGGVEKTYRELMRPPKDFSLDALASHVKHLHESGVYISVSYLAQHQNVGEISRAIDMFRDADQVTVRPAYKLTPETEPPTENDIPIVKKQIEEARSRGANIHTYTDRFTHIQPKPSCLASPLLAVCQADGNIPICCHKRYEPEYYIGNFLETPLTEIWGSDRHKKVLKSTNPEKCHHCRYGKYAKIINNYKEDGIHRCFI